MSYFLDGIDINQIDPIDLCSKNISYVSQDVNLFKGTARENILYRSSRVGDEQMLRASIISGADEFYQKASSRL